MISRPIYSLRSHKFLFWGGIFVLIITITLLIYLLFPPARQSATKPTPVVNSPSPIKSAPAYLALNNSPQTPIARVGNETIYQKDLDTELANYPRHYATTSKMLLDKIISDSRLLQASQKLGLILADKTIFDSPDKDYPKRAEEIQKLQKVIRANEYTLKGSGISIWFLNDTVGTLGYEKARETALSKITGLYKSVKNGVINMEEAAFEIKNDTSLALLDKNYQGNAVFRFLAKPGDKITWEEEFDDIIWRLKPGEITDIYTGSTRDFADKVIKPAYFMFARVEEKLDKPKYSDLDTQNYEITYY